MFCRDADYFFYTKIVQGERKTKSSELDFVFPNRSIKVLKVLKDLTPLMTLKPLIPLNLFFSDPTSSAFAGAYAPFFQRIRPPQEISQTKPAIA